jgi:hypothetical protein
VLHERLSRFEADPADPDRALPASEVLLLSQRDDANNHNGGDLEFGPDGYLYVAVGDEGAANDSLNNSQRIDKDFFSGIPPRRRPTAGELAPNPHPAVFRELTRCRWTILGWGDEFRRRVVNPRMSAPSFGRSDCGPMAMSFDPATGRLGGGRWAGAREEIDLIVRGGTTAGPGARARWWDRRRLGRGGLRFLRPPLNGRADRSRTIRNGGVVYRETVCRSYTGPTFADYVSGNLVGGGGRRDTGRCSAFRPAGYRRFGIDPRNGDVLAGHRPSPEADVHGNATGTPLPPTLADRARSRTSRSDPRPASSHTRLVPFWSDGAAKRRWFSVPETNQTFPARRRVVLQRHGLGEAPEIESAGGAPVNGAVRDAVPGAELNGLHGLTYRWITPDQCCARPEEGLDETPVPAGGFCAGMALSRAQRMSPMSHAGGGLGWACAPVERDVADGGVATNRIALLSGAGVRFTARERHLPVLRKNELASVARAFLADVNCAPCHQPGGTGLGAWDARFETPCPKRTHNGLLNNDWGDPRIAW